MGYWKATGVPRVKGHVMTDDISLLSSLLTLSLVLRVERPLAHVVRFWAILFALKFLVRCIGWAWRGAGGGFRETLCCSRNLFQVHHEAVRTIRRSLVASSPNSRVPRLVFLVCSLTRMTVTASELS